MGRYQPALLGGLFIGVLSSLPFVSLANVCCCLWVVAGGVLVTYLLQQNTAEPVQTTDVVLQGLAAGVLGGVLGGVFGLLLAPLIGPYQQELILGLLRRLQELPDMPPELKTQFDQALAQQAQLTFGQMAVGMAVQTAMFTPIAAVFSMLGSLLGLAFFRKKLPQGQGTGNRE